MKTTLLAWIVPLATLALGRASQAQTLVPKDVPSALTLFDNSLPKFSAAEGEVVRSRLKAEPLSPGIALDDEILSMMKDLDEINSMATTKVFWCQGVGTSAHPKLGIVLNRKELKQFQDLAGEKDFMEVLRLVLAHEQAHMAQFGYYNVSTMADPQKLRAVEAQADILAGATVTLSMLKNHVPANELSKERFQRWADFAQKIGTDVWDQTAHPRTDERARLVSLGYNGALQQVDLLLYRQTKDPSTWKRITDAQEDSRQRKLKEREVMTKEGIAFKTGRGYDHDLPLIDSGTFEQENMFEWSNRLAKQIVHYDDPVLGAKAPVLSDSQKEMAKLATEAGTMLFAEKYSTLRERFSETLRGQVTTAQIKQVLEQCRSTKGQLVSLDAPALTKVDGYDAFEMRCNCEKGSAVLRVVYNAKKEIQGLWLFP
jgi:hypothetical protein